MKPLTPLPILALSLLLSCSSTKVAAVTAAEVANELSHRNEEIYTVSEATCRQAESVAVELPDVNDAKLAVNAIRTRCDAAFAATDAAVKLISKLDDAIERASSGTMSAKDLAAIIVSIREAVEAAQSAQVSLSQFLSAFAADAKKVSK